MNVIISDIITKTAIALYITSIPFFIVKYGLLCDKYPSPKNDNKPTEERRDIDMPLVIELNDETMFNKANITKGINIQPIGEKSFAFILSRLIKIIANNKPNPATA